MEVMVEIIIIIIKLLSLPFGNRGIMVGRWTVEWTVDSGQWTVDSDTYG